MTLLVLSAPQEKRLVVQSATQAEWLAGPGRSENLQSIAATLSQRRAQHDFRATFVVNDHIDAANVLDSFAKGVMGDWVSQGRVHEVEDSRKTVWVFSGHGAQWPDMGKHLLQDAVFYQAVASLDGIVTREVGYSAVEKLSTGDFEDSGEIQVLTYVLQVGLIQVLKTRGLQPQAVIGHSLGEISASVAAGVLTPEEGAIVVTRRARLYQRVQGLGGMCLVNLPFEEMATELRGRKDLVAAIRSSPSSTVISGASNALADFVVELNKRKIQTFQVKTDIAFHSPMLEELRVPLEEALTDALNPQSPTVKLYSTSQADPRSPIPRDASYWVKNMVNPVLLTSAVDAAVEDGFRVFLEVSSHPIVSHSIEETLTSAGLEDFAVISTMKKGKPAQKSILHAIGQLHVKGVNVEQVSTDMASAEAVHDPNTHNLLGQRIVVADSAVTLYSTRLEEDNKPFPQPHIVHGINIIPAAVYVNTFLHATHARVLSNVLMRVPLTTTNDPRNVQVVIEGDKVKVASRLRSSDESSWVTHSTSRWSHRLVDDKDSPSLDVGATKARLGQRLPDNYSIDYLAQIGVSGIAFNWAVIEHFGHESEMITKVDNDPDNADISWDTHSWAVTLDSACSVGATVFNDNKLRIASKVDNVIMHSNNLPPKIYYLHVVAKDDSEDPRSRSVDVSVHDVDGLLLVRCEGITLTELDTSGSSPRAGVESLTHYMTWIPASLSEKPRRIHHIVLISPHEEILDRYERDLQQSGTKITKLSGAEQLDNPKLCGFLQEEDAAIVYCPGQVQSFDAIASSAHEFVWEVTTAIKSIVHKTLPAKLFVLTDRVYIGTDPTALAQSSLYGLARIAASEHSDIWGGLIDKEGSEFPTMPFKYVQGTDIVRFEDGVPRVPRLRRLLPEQRYKTDSNATVLPKPEGTYVITGGLGALGLATCDFLIKQGARRIVIISRRGLPPRNRWANVSEDLASALARIRTMESKGATVHVVSLDVSVVHAHKHILAALEQLSLPPVLGVIHASGVLEDSLLIETSFDSFGRVMAPKVQGALALHRAFPPGSLDFFVLYSSIGQLAGTAGQSSYAAGNSFLDALAQHRRSLGDNSVSFQWSAWRGMGMGTSAFLALELQTKGITDITAEDAFQAWEFVGQHDVVGAVITRCATLDEGEPVPLALFEEVAVRRPRVQTAVALPEQGIRTTTGEQRPTSTSKLKVWLQQKICQCLCDILKIGDIDEIDPRVPLSDIGVDSVMTIVLRQKLQNVLKVKVPQTLTWNYPTVSAMVDWFVEHC
ncbi:6-methylsalicylic acid synthase [Fusarium circinatum]|uniref:6-methylsalicylic acid synthase n=1 Tax=Fusarium circinatum TaxID=48490 RepID=A0A8H5WNB6_FUSCI|nr:6-methylsalicylic acid synthase [Fusarium circinatum]